jgi:phage tail-like protein
MDALELSFAKSFPTEFRQAPDVWDGGDVMPSSPAPYAQYAYVVYRVPAQGIETVLGGFAEYRGSRPGPAVGKPPRSQINDVTLKRGVVNSMSLWNWINAARSSPDSAKSSVIVTKRNDVQVPLMTWKLIHALPVHYVGPTLGGNPSDAAVETLVLSCDGIVIVPPRR